MVGVEALHALMGTIWTIVPQIAIARLERLAESAVLAISGVHSALHIMHPVSCRLRARTCGGRSRCTVRDSSFVLNRYWSAQVDVLRHGSCDVCPCADRNFSITIEE